MKNPYIVECFKDLSCKKRRKFTTYAAAVRFANDFLDDHYDDAGRWDVQVVTPSTGIHQMGLNGNNSEVEVR